MYFVPSAEDSQTTYKFLTGSITPRPIAWVSTLSKAGVANLAPYSFFTVASVNPPVLCVVQTTPAAREMKDTLKNLSDGSDAVVNIVSRNLAEAMNQSCGDYPPEVSEFEMANLATVTSQTVKAPGVADALVRFECTLREIKVVSDLPMGGRMMLLNVVGIYIADHLLKDQRIDPGLLNTVGRMAGNEYCLTNERFSMERPKV